MDDFYTKMGSCIKKERIALKLTREELAFRSNISDKFLYDIEVGKKGMSAKTLFFVAKALNVTADWLMEHQD